MQRPNTFKIGPVTHFSRAVLINWIVSLANATRTARSTSEPRGSLGEIYFHVFVVVFCRRCTATKFQVFAPLSSIWNSWRTCPWCFEIQKVKQKTWRILAFFGARWTPLVRFAHSSYPWPIAIGSVKKSNTLLVFDKNMFRFYDIFCFRAKTKIFFLFTCFLRLQQRRSFLLCLVISYRRGNSSHLNSGKNFEKAFAVLTSEREVIIYSIVDSYGMSDSRNDICYWDICYLFTYNIFLLIFVEPLYSTLFYTHAYIHAYRKSEF